MFVIVPVLYARPPSWSITGGFEFIQLAESAEH
jgi:hypothetical protein